MAKIYPFRPYRYSPSAGALANLVTQPYDKISPEMQKRYLSLSPHNLVRVILGERFATDSDAENVYTRSAKFFNDWISSAVLTQEKEPAFFGYFQEFTVPDTGEKLTRKGFIGLGAVEDYSAKVVHRHEQTLSGPKKDRRRVLEHTRAHFGQIFMLYPDPAGRIDAILDRFATGSPAAEVIDEYETAHRLYKIDDAVAIRQMQELMADKKLVIADGHHRYETAMAFRDDNPKLEDARNVMMTFVNMHSAGLRILATHRVVSGLPEVNQDAFLQKASEQFIVKRLDSTAALRQVWEQMEPEQIRIGVVFAGSPDVFLLQSERKGRLDVQVLHDDLLGRALGISAEAVREEKFLQYVRGVEAAADAVRNGSAQAAFLLEATTVQQVADTSFSGGVMPQKSTDFYPKLLTGLAIYRLEK
ncbi:MAG TPA: DUF1015 domain-containing protein [Bryobacteraceae bacterium]|nr:DUF1015 domain-containing protein [Bryobacteraceae bacterium]